jgi:hypothetical protein
MKLVLTKEEKKILANWEDSPVLGRLSKRARLIRLLTTRTSGKEIAVALNMNEQRVYEAFNRFLKDRILSLLDEPRSGRKVFEESSVLGSKLFTDLLAGEEVDSLKKTAQALRVSRDTVWRRGRLHGVNFIRQSKKQFKVFVESGMLNGVVGLVVTNRVLIAVRANHRSAVNSSKKIGVWDTPFHPLPQLVDQMDLFSALKMACGDQNQTRDLLFKNNRGLRERAQRWLNVLGNREKNKGHNFTIAVTGDFSSPDMIHWLQLLKAGIRGKFNFDATLACRVNIVDWFSDFKDRDEDNKKHRMLKKEITSLICKKGAFFSWVAT